jgi:hypothetical protein
LQETSSQSLIQPRDRFCGHHDAPPTVPVCLSNDLSNVESQLGRPRPQRTSAKATHSSSTPEFSLFFRYVEPWKPGIPGPIKRYNLLNDAVNARGRLKQPGLRTGSEIGFNNPQNQFQSRNARSRARTPDTPRPASSSTNRMYFPIPHLTAIGEFGGGGGISLTTRSTSGSETSQRSRAALIEI